ncbi:MAG: hypothetical protein KAT48_10725 [Bacteroidales bacterium]|nr:hypothetical protein [Bacteroidales bacterium]
MATNKKILSKLEEMYNKHGRPSTWGPTTDVVGLHANVDQEELYKYLDYIHIGSGLWIKHTLCDDSWREYFDEAFELLENEGMI